ncbi:MAG: hypothetical protein IJ236_03570, partial [Oscillospiraceae bacterium]|nr:hypothetical protein [Oscillospiraceae bacterium]
PGEFQVQVTGHPDFSGTADCVLISQKYAGQALRETIAHLRQFCIPCAVITEDNTLDNQEYLLGLGANEVIVPPICAGLLKRRLHALTDTPVHSDAEMNFAAFDRIMESNQGNGSFIVAEHDFMNIYRFVTRLLERLDQKAQLIIFNFATDLGPIMESDYVLNFLKIVQTSMRRGDITSVYGRQLLVILMGADETGGKSVVDRVISTFNAHYNMDEECEVSYEMREISRSTSFHPAEK